MSSRLQTVYNLDEQNGSAELLKKFDPVDEAQLYEFATKALLGSAFPEDAEIFMRFVCGQVEIGKSLSPTALGFIAEAFDGYLRLNRPLEVSFGLRRKKKGRAPSASTEQRYKRAVTDAMRQHVMSGTSLKKSLGCAADSARIRNTQMGEAWGRFGPSAAVDLLHWFNGNQTTEAQKKRLQRRLRQPAPAQEMHMIRGRDRWYLHVRQLQEKWRKG